MQVPSLGNARAGRRLSPRRPFAIAAFGTAMLGGLFSPVISSLASASTRPASTTVKPDYAYYKGKTITLVANGAVAAAADKVFRAIAPPLGTVLGATVNVIDTPTGSGIAGTNVAADANPDGLTVGYLNLNQAISNQALDQPGVNFPLSKIELVGGIKGTTSLIVSNPQVGPQTIKALLTTTTPIKVLQTAGSSFSTLVRLLIAAYHAVPVSIVYGYTSSSNLVQGFVRGDGTVTGTALTSLQSLITGGQATPLLLARPVEPGVALYQQLKNVPTPETLLKTFPPKTNAGIKALKAAITYEESSTSWMILPRNTPAKIELAMIDAMKTVWAEPQVEALIAAAGDPPGLVPASEGPNQVKQAIKSEPELAKFLGS